MGEFGGWIGRLQLQLKCLAQIVGEPMTIHKVFVVIGNVNGMVLGQPHIDAIDFWEMDTSGLREQNGSESPNIAGSIGTLEFGLHIIGHLIGLGKPKGTIVSAHPLEGTQNHSGLAMDRDCVSHRRANVGLIHDSANLFAQPDSIFGEGGDRFGLEEAL
jgi:hypothetical protein